MKPRVLTIGSFESNFCLDISRFPEKGEELFSSGVREYRCGGRGAVAAVTFANLGADCLFCGKSGADTDGARLKQIFARHKIDTRFISVARNHTTDYTVVVNEDDGSVRRLRFPGASAMLSAEDVEEAFTAYPDAVFVQLDVPVRAAIAALSYAKRQNVPIITDASPIPQGFSFDRFPSGEKFDVFITNTEKTKEITGIYPSNADNCLRACFKLATIVKADHYVIKLGARGAFLYDNTYYKIIPTYECEAVDLTAAGDAFSASLAWQYIKSKDIVLSVKYASAVASMVVSKRGGVESLPTLDEINSYINGD